jgi:phenylpropionate dioxygenase-like ring-hydroxylating dioxygenase large terminal subunit
MSNWIHTERLPHLLQTAAYHAPDIYARELAQVFRPGWHCIGSTHEFAAKGDFVTDSIAGAPIIVQRTQDHELRGFLNVCAHRHALLTHEARGNQRRLRCQYHGWEYDADGVACKIPDAACFVPLTKGDLRLQPIRVDTLGPLVFVSLAPTGAGLRESLGPQVASKLEAWFRAAPRLAVSLSIDHPCNWKVPIENVLESYHVPLLHDNFVARHPRVFRFFQGAPGVGRKEAHELGDKHTTVHDELGTDSALYKGLLRWFRPDASVAFEHVHAFPSLLLGQTAVVTFVQSILPLSPTRCRSLVRIFLDLGQQGRPLAERMVARAADRAARELFLLLMREDGRIFEAVQRGLETSQQPGVLGTREERIHAFHQYLRTSLDGVAG